MVDLSKPPLPPNKPYCWPLNNFKYVKNSNPDAHFKKFEVTIRINNEIHNVEIIHLFSFTLRDIMSDWCNNHMGDYLDCIFTEL